MPFGPHFLWGAATSSYQIEGGVEQDGAGPSIFEPYCRIPAAPGGVPPVFMNHNGASACDHYHRFREDVGLMKQIGLRAFRFSVSWPRVLPEGTGRINQAGLGFYDRLVDELLAAGIQPWLTLFHWDLPLAIHNRGGWLNRDIAEWFAEYAQVVVERLSDRVTHWMTLNEPQVFIKYGYGDGTLAPGFRLALEEQVRACHHALLAHGRAVQVIRSRAKEPATVGWAIVGRVDYPATESAADIDAARRGMMDIAEGGAHLWNNTWYGDPVVFGHYPEDGLRTFGPAAQPPVQPGDMQTIAQKLDFYGVNIYDGRCVKAGADGGGGRGGGGRTEVVTFGPGHPQTAIRWFITPPCLRWGPRFLFERYKLPIYITENGMSNIDWVAMDGRVHDPQRIDYTRRYLLELEKAIADGADIRGYFHWSLLDNFEWTAGYRERFGLIHVDFDTKARTIKDSAHWYRTVIESNGAALKAG